MTPTRVLTLLAVAAAAGPAAAEPADAPRPKVVLRVSQAFVESLTRQTFDEVNPIATTRNGATVVGTSRVSAGYTVAFLRSTTEAAFELRVAGTVDTDLGVTRRPVRVQLDGRAGLTATRRVVFDGTTYTAGPIGVAACYESTLEGIGTPRRGPLAPLVRRVARPVVLRRLPEADRAASAEVRARTHDRVARDTDRVVAMLNTIHAARTGVTQDLRVLVPDAGRLALATTDDALLAGLGFPEGAPPTLPAAADGPPAPVEVWVYRPTPALRAAVERARGWGERVRPRLVAQLERHSPALARRVESATYDVTIDVPGAPGWHRIRFFKELDTRF